MNKMKNFLFRFAILVLVLVILLSAGSASASSIKYEDVPYTNYTYWSGYTNKKAVATRAVYEPILSVDMAKFSGDTGMSLQYVTCDNNRNTYVLDSDGGRVFVFDNTYKLTKVIDSVLFGEKKLTFSGAKGLHIDKDNIMYIADTDNQRVICCRDNVVINILEKPQSSIIPTDFIYAPTHMVKDKNGFLYVLCEGSYYGLMVFSNENEFLGFFGANKVATDIFGVVKEWVTSIFDTKEKHEGTVKKLPYQLADISVSKRGFICGVTGEASGQIRMFAPTGANILSATQQFTSIGADDFNFADFPNNYVDTTSAWSDLIKQSFVGISTDDDGYIYSIDSTHGRIYMYDEGCNLISVFGGGTGKGTQLGTFITPISIAVNGEDIVAIDFVNNNMTVFRISDFGRQFKTAQSLTLSGEYEEAKPYWESVNGSDKNCQLAYIGLAKAALSEKNYEAAMSYAKSGLDQSTYAQAYKFVRNDFISHNFWWMVCVAVLIVAAFFIFKHYKKKKNLEFHINERLKTCLGTLLRPVETFNCVKYKGGGSVALATACLALFYLATVSVKLLGGFMFNLVDVSSFNAIYTLLGTVGVVLLYVLVNWAVCILFEGKGRLREIYCVTCYSLQPLMLYSILFVVMSYVIIPSSNSGFGIAQVFFTGMFIIWMLISITIVHEFSFFKAIGMGLVIILGMGIAAFIVFIMLTLGQDLIGFLIGIFKEVTLR